MNLRTTPLLFGLLLGVLWLFGLMLVYKRTAVDASALVPTLQGADVKIDMVRVQFKDKKEADDVLFINENDAWYLKQHGQKVKVESFRVEQLVRQAKDAKKYEEFRPSEDLGEFGLSQPRITVTLKGKVRDRDREVKFYVGRESPDKTLVYANSSDFPGKAYAVVKANLDSVLFKDANYLRSKRIFDFVESSATDLEVHDGKEVLALKKTEEGIWKFEKPALGFAGFESGQSETDLKKDLPGEPPTNVKGLISAIGALSVEKDDDLVPLGNDLARYGVEDGKEAMRIQVTTGGKKDAPPETLLIGKKVPQRDQVYARLLSDDGVMQVSTRSLEPIKKAVAEPGKIRSNDIASFEAKNVDALTVTQGKKAYKLLHPEGLAWQVAMGGDKARKADEKAVQGLLEALQGKRAIVDFYDGKDETWGGLGSPVAEISVYLNALEKADPKAEKKDDKKKEIAPALKKDAKPTLALAIGATDKELVHVKRTLQDGTVSRFSVPKSVVAKFELDQGALATLDKGLTPISPADVARLELKRGKETLELVKDADSKKTPRWSFKDGKAADTAKVESIVNGLGNLQSKKWLGTAEDLKSDLEKLGIDDPALTVTLFVKSGDAFPSAGVVGVLGVLGALTPGPLPAAAMMAASQAVDKGQPITFSFGKEAADDKTAVAARRVGEDLLFHAPADVAKYLREIDLRDRSMLVALQPLIDATALALADQLLASPAVTGAIHSFDTAKAKEVKLTVRTSIELRTVTFQRTGKDKDSTWQEGAGLQEFQLDPEKVSQLVDQISKIRTERFVSFHGPSAEHKLSAKEAPFKVELTFEDGGVVTLTVGAPFERVGYFAHSTAWPDAVFFLPSATVEPWLRGISAFGKERVAAAP